MEISPRQSRAARGLLDWTQDNLATRAGVSLKTVQDFEGELDCPGKSGELFAHRSAISSSWAIGDL